MKKWGKKLLGLLLCTVMIAGLLPGTMSLARAEGKEIVYISTDHEGLYEKYGAVYESEARDRRGGDTRIYRLDTYGFYGWQEATVPAKNQDYPGIHTPRDLYNRLWDLWCADTCAPRMRGDSEQFGGQRLTYEGNPEQFRDEHFRKEEKRQRYEKLKASLKACTG